MTNKQSLFIKEYLVDLNATQAAIRAGYSEKTAQRIASENLSKPVIQKAIQKALEERNRRIEINADYVLKRLIDIDGMDVLDILEDSGDIKPIKDWPKTWRITISGIDIATINSGDIDAVLKKIKWPDKVKNLELIGRHVDVQAWKDKIEHSGEVGITIASDEDGL